DFGKQLTGGSVAPFGQLLEGSETNRVQIAPKSSVQARGTELAPPRGIFQFSGDRRGLAGLRAQYSLTDLVMRLSDHIVRRSADEKLVQEQSQSVDVRRGRHVTTTDLFGSRVRRRHDPDAGLGQDDLVGSVLEHLGDAEVQQFDGTVRRDEN